MCPKQQASACDHLMRCALADKCCTLYAFMPPVCDAVLVLIIVLARVCVSVVPCAGGRYDRSVHRKVFWWGIPCVHTLWAFIV